MGRRIHGVMEEKTPRAQRIQLHFLRRFKCCCIISFPYVKDGPVSLKEIRKEALNHLSLALRDFDQLV